MDISKENLYQAFNLIDSNPNLLKGRNSSTYDLIYKGKKYPPILVLSEANKINGGKELFLEDFGNNVSTAFKILKDHGFEIVQKNTMNNKDKFESWLTKSLPKNSGTISSYMRSLSLLGESFHNNKMIKTNSIFEINDISVINKLYKETIEKQRDINSFIYRKESPSYGDKGFFSASLKKYIEFLNTYNTKKDSIETKTIKFECVNFDLLCRESNLNFSSKLILRFIASLTAKPFVILSGLSGSGKTKIAQSFVQWICEDENQYKIVPVGADWTNREPLVGYPNGLVVEEYITPDSGVIHLLMDAVKIGNENKPFFLILDEMNLSHVERYFADFLSIMESNDTIKLYTGNARESLDGFPIPLEIGWPKNVFIIGTVNIDETTYMFSPKVLDRANVIEFRITNQEIKSFLKNPSKPNLEKLKGKGIKMAESFLSIASQNSIVKNDDLAKELVSFFDQLQLVGAEFGYRSAKEIMQLAAQLKMLEPSITNYECLDIAIMQKLLPKLHGSRSKLVKILIALSGLCLEDIYKEEFEKKFDDYYKSGFDGLTKKYPISFEKLIRMYKNVLANGFTTYAEA